ncbi:MAG: helix-turn-helix domain-containing protein [Chloroflexota bacterium]|nr:helix-turn-helix domain-containing protein [Chloroflexota bacterium]MDE2909472.1 helix-turn-helix domain-containing protein [Chloroflexota bacterium]
MSITRTPDLTVEEIRKLALPLSTHVLSGEGMLDRPVSWTTIIHPEDDIVSKSVQRSELILVASVSNPPKAHSDTELVQWAARASASAVVFSDQVSTTALAESKARDLPVLALSGDVRIREVEKSIISLLVNRKGQIERRGTQIYRQLTQISSRNEGMKGLLAAMARLTKKTIIVHDKRLHALAHKLQPEFAGIWDDIEFFLKKQDNLPVELHDRHRVVEVDPPVLMQALPVSGVARLVAPIITKSLGRGYLSIIGRESDLDEIDQLVCEHGAAACALEMAKQKAVNETEKRLRGTFLDRLLLGDVSQQEAIRQGERFNHDMTQTHVAFVLSWRGDSQPSLRRLETIVNEIIAIQQTPALVWMRAREGEVVVFHATDFENPIDASLALSDAFSQEINRQYPLNHIAIGLGQVARDVNVWRSSYRDAVQAKELAERLQTDIPLFIGDLGVYQLILSLSDRDKLADFCDVTLGTLSEYDSRQKADLLKTLEAFFNCHGNLSQTAESLIIHRNTLLYRMNRINEIAGIDLNRPETRLALHLALTIRRLLSLA